VLVFDAATGVVIAQDVVTSGACHINGLTSDISVYARAKASNGWTPKSVSVIVG
jgi:hypothetical protein